jgi:RNA polymerase sigma-70 factor (ECF subfamily)
MQDDLKLIEGCIKGDRKMQRQLYEQFSPRMMAVSLRYAKSQLEAEDILQEAFIKVFNKIETFRKESSLYHWIKTIVINTALSHQRSKLYQFPMGDVKETDFSSSEDFSLSDFHFNELLGMIQTLPAGCQMVFNLYAIEGYKHHEIAEMLEISEGTSKSQFSRARVLLQGMLEKKTKREVNYE